MQITGWVSVAAGARTFHERRRNGVSLMIVKASGTYSSDRVHDGARRTENRKAKKLLPQGQEASRLQHYYSVSLLLFRQRAPLKPKHRQTMPLRQSRKPQPHRRKNPQLHLPIRTRQRQNRKQKRNPKPIPTPGRMLFKKRRKTRSRVSSASLSRTTIILESIPATGRRMF
jgi:hypothetical protein